jgi:uncharacterized protein
MIIGRAKEQEVLLDVLDSRESEMVAVIGRRRVGKTFLVRQVYADLVDLEITGIQHASMKEQIQSFTLALKKTFEWYDFPKTPKTWLSAFHLLTNCLDSYQKEGKKIIFLDELPWFSTHKSGFITALGWFWNSWATRRNDVILVICGSAASWMIQKIVNDRGGLHNRITKRIFLMPFDLQETEMYLKSRNINLERYHILQLYMAFGGIPHYLKEVKPGKTAAQNIEAICLHPSGLLFREFDRLYPALFEFSENHIAIIRALASVNSGLNRREIMELTGLLDGGGTSRFIEELKMSGFVSVFYPFEERKKELYYRLTDEYSLFYLKFIENMEETGEDAWVKLSETQTYKTWSGYAFENICLKHTAQIKKALGISGVYSQTSNYYKKGTKTESGIQIDLLIDRNDKVINLCELKFYHNPWTLTRKDREAILEKTTLFKSLTKTKKQVFFSAISTFGIKQNEYSLGCVDNTFSMDILFEKL